MRRLHSMLSRGLDHRGHEQSEGIHACAHDCQPYSNSPSKQHVLLPHVLLLLILGRHCQLPRDPTSDLGLQGSKDIPGARHDIPRDGLGLQPTNLPALLAVHLPMGTRADR